MLHMGMFIPTIFGQASAEQQAKWLPLAFNMHYVGTYAQVSIHSNTLNYDDYLLPQKKNFNSPAWYSSRYRSR